MLRTPPATRLGLLALAGTAVLAGSLAGCTRPPPGGASNGQPAQRSLSVFYTTDRDGYLEPCGCQSEPLGFIDRLAGLIAEKRAKGHAVLVLEAGDTLFESAVLPAAKREQELLKGRLLVDLMGDLGVRAIALGETDLAAPPVAASLLGKNRVALLAANATFQGKPLAGTQRVELAGVRIGLFGVVDPALLGADAAAAGVSTSDPLRAAQDAVGQLLRQQVDVVIGLSHTGRPLARRIARAVKGIDFLIVGHLGEGVIEPSRPQRVGDTVLLAMGNHARFVGKLDLHWPAATPVAPSPSPAGGEPEPRFAQVISADQAKEEAARLGERIQLLRGRLAEWAKRQEQGAFVDKQKQEVATLEAQQQSLLGEAGKAPAGKRYFSHEAVKVGKKLPANQGIRERIAAYDKQVGELNCARAPTQPPQGKPKEATYVGNSECQDCHPKAQKVWEKTEHSHAYATLEKAGKQFNESCVSCHVIGYMQPGGAVLCNEAVLKDRKNVGCESCHGPGSLHVAAGGKEQPPTMRRKVPAEYCRDTCHNPENSDKFDYAVYLPKIVGPGHGQPAP